MRDFCAKIPVANKAHYQERIIGVLAAWPANAAVLEKTSEEIIMIDKVSKTNRPLVIVSIVLATFMVAIEATIVATAMPHIVGELGGFTYYSWVFSAFLLAQSTTTIIYGKLSDTFGRKPILVVGIIIFLIASTLAGFAWSMASLIGFRLLQGIGAGAITPVAMTVVGDLYTLEKRAKVQGGLATVWAFSAVVGPLAGGLIVDYVSWGWIFWINIPLGILTILGFVLFLHETIEHRQVKIDYLGTVLFSIAIVSLLIMLTETDAGFVVLTALAVLVVVAGYLFLLQERRAPEPIISLELWSRRLIATSNTVVLLAGMALIGLTTMLPIYVQGVLGRSPLVAGFTLTMLIVGWPLAVMLSGRLFSTFGIRNTLRVGSCMFPLGAALLPFLHIDSSPVVAGIGAFMMGFGMGLINFTSIILVQESVDWSMRGSATASIIFSRSLGNTLGATALGAILNVGILHFGSGELADQLHNMLNQPAGLINLSSNPAIQSVFYSALHWTFWGVFVVAVLTFITTWLVPVSTDAGRKNAQPTTEQKIESIDPALVSLDEKQS